LGHAVSLLQFLFIHDHTRRLKLLIFVPLLLSSMARQRVKVSSFCLLGALVPAVAVVPTAADLVLAAFEEEVADSCSTLFMRLDGGLGLLILAAAVMRPGSSTNPVRAFAGRRRGVGSGVPRFFR
jgi:hypothetical protein